MMTIKTIVKKWTKLAKRPPHYLTEDEWLLVRGFYSTLYIMLIQVDEDDSLEKLNHIYDMLLINFNMITNRLDNKKSLMIWTEFYNSIDELLEDYELIEEYKLCQNIYDLKKLFELSESR